MMKTAYRLMMKQVGGGVDEEQDQVLTPSSLSNVYSAEHVLGDTPDSDIPQVDPTGHSS